MANLERRFMEMWAPVYDKWVRECSGMSGEERFGSYNIALEKCAARFIRQVANKKLEEAAKAIDAHAECYSQSQSYPTFQSDIENMAEEIRALKFPEGE